MVRGDAPMARIYKDKKELIETLIPRGASVLDVGFRGQGTGPQSEGFVHALLRTRTEDLWGIDLQYEETELLGPSSHYARMSAESFSLSRRFTVLFAGDLIEHLPNPGLFLDSAKRHLEKGGCLILTTPNAFNLFNLTEKITKDEPTVNSDHTCYFNRKTLLRLLDKMGWEVDEVSYLFTLGPLHKESLKKKLLNLVYSVLARCTPKFVETLVVVAHPRP
ncbi:MAG: class I SAM-dependent methyltransferase [Minisyncoccia bacterium]